jgi:hypothetical protein
MNKFYFLFFLVFIFSFHSCTNDYQNHDCDPIICNQPGGPVYYYDLNQVDYANPVFNPNNNSEFVALRIVRGNDTTSQQLSLVKVNYVNQTQQTLMSNAYMISNNISICGLNWSSTGWIAFKNCNTGQICKVADDGTGFQQLTSGSGSFNPCFTYDGTKIFFSELSTGFLMDVNTGAYLDTIVDISCVGAYASGACLSNNRMITSMPDNVVRVINLNGLNLISAFVPITNISNFTNFTEFKNLSASNSDVIFNTTAGICKLNLIDHSIILIKETCSNRMISSMCVSPDGTKIIYQLDKLEVPNESCSIRQQTEIHLMDLNGSNDQLLVLQ